MCNKSTPRSDCLSSPASQNTAASRTHPPSTMLYTLLAMQCITASAFVAVPMAAQRALWVKPIEQPSKPSSKISIRAILQLAFTGHRCHPGGREI